MNEYQKTFDMCLKIFVYGCVALYFLGFLKFLPDDLSDKISEDLRIDFWSHDPQAEDSEYGDSQFVAMVEPGFQRIIML